MASPRPALVVACGLFLALSAVGAAPPDDLRPVPLRLTSPSFTVVPPGPVSERVRVELRLAVPNTSAASQTAEVAWYWDATREDCLISRQTVALAPRERGLVRAWAACSGRAGAHVLLARVRQGGRTVERSWRLTVLPADAPPRFGAVWFDPGGLTAYAHDGEMKADDVRRIVRAMHGLGIETFVVTYVEYFGRFYYPSRLTFYDRDVKAETGGMWYGFDVVEAVLSAADECGMHVFLGLGRGGDTPLLWEFDAADWPARNAQAVGTSRRVALDLWRRYRHHGSLYGWYLTHEMADLARASAYYNPVAEFCHALSPDKPVMVAPAGSPVITPDLLRASAVDIFAYGDAVGPGYVPGKYTYQPENRLAVLDTSYRQYCSWHEGTDKHLWTDLELWEMDGTVGYSGAYPAAWDRVRRQLAAEAPHVEFVTAYECSGFLQDPAAPTKLVDPRASQLFRDYQTYLRGSARDGR